MAADDAAKLRQEADRLALLAEQAALEAESLEIKAQMARPEGPAEPAPPAPAVAADDEGPMVLSSPLRWIGPYPAVALSFPALSSPAQKARMLQAAGVGGDPTTAGVDTGVTLDFVLDTAANTNTINAQVAGPTSQGGLELEQVGAVAGRPEAIKREKSRNAPAHHHHFGALPAASTGSADGVLAKPPSFSSDQKVLKAI